MDERKTMNVRLRFSRWWSAPALLTLGLLASGCSDNPTANAPGIEQERRATEAAHHLAQALTLSMEAQQTAEEFSAPARAGKMTAGTAAAGCPVITMVADDPVLELHLDFGDGCTTEEDEWHKGRISAVFTEGAMTMTFDDYQTNEGGFDGRLRVVLGAPIRHYLENITLSQGAEWATFNTELAVAVDLNEPFVEDDNEARFTGSGSVANSSGEAFTYEITEALTALGSCAYLTRGKVAARFTDEQGRQFDAELDYLPEDGSCDDVVAITIEGETIVTQIEEPAS